MHEYKTRQIDKNTRVQWVWDEDYQTVGHYAYFTEEQTKKTEDWELERLKDGRLIALGAIVQHCCPHCCKWHDGDPLWGIVIDGTSADKVTEQMGEYERNDLDLKEGA